MKFSYSWLKQLVDVNLPAEKLAELLSLHAFETEVVSGGQEFDGLIVAKVTKVEKHPNADRLRVIHLSDGKHTIGPVVCGAWNFDTGAIVALALPGALIPHDQHDPEGKSFRLSKATIRGVESQGMICSAKELGLGSDGGGIMLLDNKYKLGEKFATKPDSSDTQFDISVPAHRPDLISYRGIAWEIAALTGKKYLAKQSKSISVNAKQAATFLKVRISDSALCKKYIGVRLVNVKIGPSPKFIQERIKAAGLRPINNVVDITNYVMLEVGQPMHAFDANKVIGQINVRKAYMQESVTTLDGVKRKLTPDMLLIADSQKVLAIAGVIGGENSSVSDKTTELVLESANFNSVSVRRTSRALNLRTDASSRFEKSLPVEFAQEACDYAVELLEKYAGAKAIEFATAGSKSEKRTPIKVDPAQINQLLGINVTASEQKKILKKLGFTVLDSKFYFLVSVPFWRPDVTIWQDLAEEIVRFKGLDSIKSKSMSFPVSVSLTHQIVDLKDKATDLLVGLGFDELYTYSFLSKQDLDRWHIDAKTFIEVANPLSLDQQFMRPNLGPNILKIAEHNSKFVPSGNHFEIANVYWKDNGKVLEKTYLFMMSFDRTTLPVANLTRAFSDFCARMGIVYHLKQEEEQLAHIMVGNKMIGGIGTFEVSDLKWVGVSVDFEELIKHISRRQFSAIPKYPSKELDVALLVREDLSWDQIKNHIKHPLIAKVELFDVYQGKNISPGKKSLAFRIVYQATDHTLTDEEVNKVHDQIISTLEMKLGALIRD